MTPGLRNFSLFLSSIFICELILIQIFIIANIEKTQICYKLKYALRGYLRLYKVIFLFKNSLLLRFCLKSDLVKKKYLDNFFIQSCLINLQDQTQNLSINNNSEENQTHTKKICTYFRINLDLYAL